MIEDVIGTHTGDAELHARKRHIFKEIAVQSSQLHIADLVVTTRPAIIDIYTNLRRVDAEIKLLSQSATSETQVLDIERVTEKEPSPTEERSYLRQSVGRQSDMLAVAAEIEVLKRTSHLHHHRKLVVLGLYVIIFQAVEASDGLTDNAYLTFLNRVSTKRILRKEHDARQQRNQQHPPPFHRQSQIFPKIRSITQLTGVADTLVHVHTPKPCRCSITALMSGYCT